MRSRLQDREADAEAQAGPRPRTLRELVESAPRPRLGGVRWTLLLALSWVTIPFGWPAVVVGAVNAAWSALRGSWRAALASVALGPFVLGTAGTAAWAVRDYFAGAAIIWRPSGLLLDPEVRCPTAQGGCIPPPLGVR